MEDDSFLASEIPKHFMRMSLVLRQNMHSMNSNIAWTNSKLSLLDTSHDSLRLREQLYESLHHTHNIAHETFVRLKEFVYRAPCFPSEQEEWSRYRDALQDEFTGILSALWKLQQVVYAKEKRRVERTLVTKVSIAEVHLKGGSQQTAMNRSLQDHQGALRMLERDLRVVDMLVQACNKAFCSTMTETDSRRRYCNPYNLNELKSQCTSGCRSIVLALLCSLLVYSIYVTSKSTTSGVSDGLT